MHRRGELADYESTENSVKKLLDLYDQWHGVSARI